jgi:hypothetical protein
MTAGIIQLSGAWGGKTFGASRHNRKGMFENSIIRQNYTKPFLRSLGVDPLGQKPLPDIDQVKLVTNETVNNWRIDIQREILKQGYKKGSWYYKGAKMCLFWPLWVRAFPDAHWVIVRRKSEDIVRSCLNTGFMKAYKTTEGWLGWVDEHKERFIEMEEANCDIDYVWPQRMIDFDLSEIESVIKKLGLKWNKSDVENFIEPAYWSGGQSSQRRTK